MTQNEIIEMADKADAEADNVLNMKGEYHPNWHQVRDEIFAKLVAARTLMNIDPSKFMSYQEGIDAGRFAEREACAKLVEELDERGFKELAGLIRARGEA